MEWQNHCDSCLNVLEQFLGLWVCALHLPYRFSVKKDNAVGEMWNNSKTDENSKMECTLTLNSSSSLVFVCPLSRCLNFSTEDFNLAKDNSVSPNCATSTNARYTNMYCFCEYRKDHCSLEAKQKNSRTQLKDEYLPMTGPRNFFGVLNHKLCWKLLLASLLQVAEEANLKQPVFQCDQHPH